MAKVVGQSPINGTTAHLFDNAFGHQFFQGNDCLFLTTATGLTEGIKIEGASNDGGSVEQLPACLTYIDQTRMQQVTHTTGERPVLVAHRQVATRYSVQIFDEEE